MTSGNLNTVLLVENEPLIALDLEGMLLSAGAGRVHHVMSSAEALQSLDMARPDLVILDVVVKDGPSIDVAARLRRDRVPFVVHSGHSRHSSPHADSLGDAVWLAKPCTEADLSSAITEALRRTL